MGVSLPSRRVVGVLDEFVALHGRPAAVRIDNGPKVDIGLSNVTHACTGGSSRT